MGPARRLLILPPNQISDRPPEEVRVHFFYNPTHADPRGANPLPAGTRPWGVCVFASEAAPCLREAQSECFTALCMPQGWHDEDIVWETYPTRTIHDDWTDEATELIERLTTDAGMDGYMAEEVEIAFRGDWIMGVVFAPNKKLRRQAMAAGFAAWACVVHGYGWSPESLAICFHAAQSRADALAQEEQLQPRGAASPAASSAASSAAPAADDHRAKRARSDRSEAP